MKKLFVEDVKVGVSKGGMACGPVSGSVVAEVCIRDLEEKTVKYYSLSEVEGIPNFFETDDSTYDRQIEELDDEEFWEMLSTHAVDGFSDYVDVFENQEDMELHDSDLLLIWKYLVYMVRADWDEIEELKAESVGKCLGDFEIPVSDVEQEYLDDMADEETENETENETEDEGPETMEEMISALNDEFSGLEIRTSEMNLEEGETAEGSYSAEVDFSEGQNDYKMEYGFDVNDEAEIMFVETPKVKKLVGDEYVLCPDGEVSIKRIYEVLRDELDSWL